jgi:hypothetical protein
MKSDIIVPVYIDPSNDMIYKITYNLASYITVEEGGQTYSKYDLTMEITNVNNVSDFQIPSDAISSATLED